MPETNDQNLRDFLREWLRWKASLTSRAGSAERITLEEATALAAWLPNEIIEWSERLPGVRTLLESRNWERYLDAVIERHIRSAVEQDSPGGSVIRQAVSGDLAAVRMIEDESTSLEIAEQQFAHLRYRLGMKIDAIAHVLDRERQFVLEHGRKLSTHLRRTLAAGESPFTPLPEFTAEMASALWRDVQEVANIAGLGGNDVERAALAAVTDLTRWWDISPGARILFCGDRSRMYVEALTDFELNPRAILDHPDTDLWHNAADGDFTAIDSCERAAASLDEIDQQIAHLRYGLGRYVDEIASIMDMPIDEIYERGKTVNAKIREELDKSG